jgi:hypothetical protein
MDQKLGIVNLSKWTEKLLAVVRRICNRKPGPCVGFSLLFLDPMAPPEAQWNFVIELAGHPDHPMPPEERKELVAAFEHIMAGAMQLLGGKIDEEGGELSQYTAKGDLH